MHITHPYQITVMLGGFSSEREVSLASGRAVVKALRELGHRVTELDIRNENWELPSQTEIVFVALHGTYGEDGAVQKKLEALGVPFTGCDSRTSRIAFDKIETKQHLLDANLPTAKYFVVDEPATPWPDDWCPPVVLKPVCQGSSVGLQFVEDSRDWGSALIQSMEHGDRILVEEKIVGRETTVGILDGIALPIVEVCPKQGVYDYHNKYTDGATDHFCPAHFPDEITAMIQEVAVKAYQLIQCRDYARVDVMVDGEFNPFVLEINTLPGMTRLSLFPEAAAASGIKFNDLCGRMIDGVVARTGLSTPVQCIESNGDE